MVSTAHESQPSALHQTIWRIANHLRGRVDAFFGQRTNLATHNFAWINRLLHGVSYGKFDIAHGDTLPNPQLWDDRPFEAIVAGLKGGVA